MENIIKRLTELLFDYASALAYEDIEEGRSPITSYQEYVEELELVFRDVLKNTFEYYEKTYEENKVEEDVDE